MTKAIQQYRSLIRFSLVFELCWWGIVYFGWTVFSGNGISFLHPEFLWGWLILIPWYFFIIQQWKNKATLFSRYEGMGETRVIWVQFNTKKALALSLSLRTFIFCVILAMSQPVSGTHKINGNKKILDLVVCLDISNSMNTKDMGNSFQKESRLTAAKHALDELLNQMKGERISLITFANDAVTQLPLTLDYGAAKLFLPDIETNMISNQGTNIGQALKVAKQQFKDSEAGKAILVITDGEDHEKLWQDQVAELNEKQVELYYLGLGTTQGGLIPNDPNDASKGYKRNGGKPIVSKLDVGGIQKMAQASSSNFLISSSNFPPIHEITNHLKNSKSKKLQHATFEVANNYFYIPTWGAIISFCLYLLIPFFQKKQKS